jgi:Na+/H+-dicarboxylate symporter
MTENYQEKSPNLEKAPDCTGPPAGQRSAGPEAEFDLPATPPPSNSTPSKGESGWWTLAVAVVAAVVFGGFLGKAIWQAQGGPKEKIAQLEAELSRLQGPKGKSSLNTNIPEHPGGLVAIEQEIRFLRGMLEEQPPLAGLLRILGEVVSVCGQVYLRLLLLLVLPLLLISVATGVGQLGQQASLGRLIGYAFLYYLTTSAIAVLVGIFLVQNIRPGLGLTRIALQAAEGASTPRPGILQTLAEVIRGQPDRPGSGLIPSNLVAAAAETNVVGILFFAILLGLALAGMGPRGQPLLELLERANELMLRLVRAVIAWAPVGVFGLIASQIIQQGGWEGFVGQLGRLGLFVVAVLLGLTIQGIFLVGIAAVIARQKPWPFLSQVTPAMATAFGTSSSAATLPVSIQCASELRVNRSLASFVLPLGATFNMDGTALYEAMAAIFLAQLAGISLQLPEMMIIFVTASLAAIGAPGIPNAGLVTLLLVLTAAGIPAEGIALLFTVDWFLDRCRTMINVLGDLVGATVLHRYFPTPRATP